MNNEAYTLLLNRIEYLQSNLGNLVLDGDTHPSNLETMQGEIEERYKAGPNYYQGRPISTDELITEMNMASIDMALSWQNPAVIRYGDDLEVNYQLLLQANDHIFQSAKQYPHRILPAGWTDPKALGLNGALAIVEKCIKEFGFPIVKLNPAQNAYPIDSEMVFDTVSHIVEMGAIPAFHYGGDTPYTSAEGLQKVAEKFPGTTIIAVHMGGGGSHYVEGELLYQQTRELGLRNPNIFFILSAKRDCHIESDLITYQQAGIPYSHNIACGSDAPYGRMTWNYGGYRQMFDSLLNGEKHTDKRLLSRPDLFNEDAVAAYMGTNLMRLYISAGEALLQKYKQDNSIEQST